MCLSPRTLELLERAGYRVGRKIDVTKYESALASQGYAVSAPAREFLQEFGGLVVLDPDPIVPRSVVLFHLDPARALPGYWPGNIRWYEERIGEKLVVVGEACEDRAVLVMSESGRIYAGLDQHLIQLGNDGREALETLCGDTPGTMVEIP